jgi:hypothetical protein
MGVRPPQQGDDDAPETVAFGIAALDDHLERADVTFPMTDEELIEALGDPAVPYDAMGNELRLSEALEELSRVRFETRQEFLNAVHPVFEAERERANNSLLGQLRSLLPF